MLARLTICALALVVCTAANAEKLDCFLTGSLYRNEANRSGSKAIWYFDGMTLRPRPKGDPLNNPPVPLAYMTIAKRDESQLVATLPHPLPNGGEYKFVMDMKTGDVTEYLTSGGRHTSAEGSCKLLAD